MFKTPSISPVCWATPITAIAVAITTKAVTGDTLKGVCLSTRFLLVPLTNPLCSRFKPVI